MNVELFDDYPHAELGGELRTLLADARRIDAAVAFVTTHGCDFFRHLIALPTTPRTRLVASVRFPTNLRGLADIAEKFPGRVWIHTGYKEPHEAAADRGQFHSKLIIADLGGDERLVIVGSHNWTENALCGHNLEAGIILRCRGTDDVVQSARRHIDACIAESQAFNVQDLRFYETVQRRLHIGPDRLPTEPFPGFDDFESLVIHAEDGTNGETPEPLRLFVPVREPGASPFFRDGRRVQLFLYPPGTLHDHRPPAAVPSVFDGHITMINELSDAPVDQRLADCELTGLRRPTIKMLAGNVPAPSGESRQVIVHLQLLGQEHLPIYHSDSGAPNLRLGVSYERMTLDDVERRLPEGRRTNAAGEQVDHQPHRRIEVPSRLIVAAAVCIPSQELYSFDLKPLLRNALHGSEFVNQDSAVLEVDIVNPSKKEVLNDFVYNVYYRFSKEALARAERQATFF